MVVQTYSTVAAADLCKFLIFWNVPFSVRARNDLSGPTMIVPKEKFDLFKRYCEREGIRFEVLKN